MIARDIMNSEVETLPPECTIGEPVSGIMNREPPKVRDDDTVLECAARLFHGPRTVHLLPVVNDSGNLVGAIVPFDLIKGIA